MQRALQSPLTTIKCLSNVYALKKLNHHRRNNNLLSLLPPTVQDEISRIEQIKSILLSNFQKNSNFRNSKSCRIFDEVKSCQTLYSTHQSIITIMQKTNNHQNRPQCHMKYQEMPCNQQFERRYIIPKVTYVEKPNGCNSILQ